MKVNIEVDIPNEVLKRLAGQEVWSGRLACKLSSFSGSRKDMITAKIKKAQAKVYFQLANGERKIFEHWNKNPYIESLIKDRSSGESRNFPITLENFLENKRIYKLCIERIGVDKIINLMDSYFESCKNDEHIWDSLNHAFKNLIGFLGKISKAEIQNEKLWWKHSADAKRYEDKHSELTLMIADAFAVRFLNKEKYGLINPSRDYRSFMHVANSIEDFFCRNKTLPFDEDEFVGYVLKALERHADTVDMNILYPGTLTARTLWDVVIPQYLNEIWPGFDFKW